MFFKTSNPAALAAWEQYILDSQQLNVEARKLADVLGCGGRAVFKHDVGGRWFYAMSFPGEERPFARELWTVSGKPLAGAASQGVHVFRLTCGSWQKNWRIYGMTTDL